MRKYIVGFKVVGWAYGFVVRRLQQSGLSDVEIRTVARECGWQRPGSIYWDVYDGEVPRPYSMYPGFHRLASLLMRVGYLTGLPPGHYARDVEQLWRHRSR